MELLVKNWQLFSTLFFACFAFMVVVQAQNQSDFISIDCGLPEKNNTDAVTGIYYVSDEGFTDEGISMNISANNQQMFSDQQQFLNVRSFPNGTKNCYKLQPSKGKGRYYLIRARFMYGNYDSLSTSPIFDLYLDVNFWDTVTFNAETEIFTKEIIYFPPSDYVNVCLVNKGSGTPFISVLELRLLNNQSYAPDSGSLDLYLRLNFNSNVSRIRYSATDQGGDYSDRIWYASNSMSWNNISTNNAVDQGVYNSFEVAASVMRTAITPANNSGQMGFYWIPPNSTYQYYVYMHFAEIKTLRSNQSREFDIFLNGNAWYQSFSPSYLSTSTVYSGGAEGPYDRYEFWLNKTGNSTHPPLINAMEVYRVVHLRDLQTDQKDVDAVTNIKSTYQLRRNWVGDPCAPRAFLWEGLLCNYSGLNSDSNIPRIISLNLSSSGLKWEIAPSIASLTELQYLDLSNNSLQGSFPDFLSTLQFLKVLNLERNNLSGSVPHVLLERSKNSSLSLYLDNNPHLCTSEYCSTETDMKNKKNVLIPVVAAVGGFIFLSLLVKAAALWRFKRRNGSKKDDDKPANQFTYSEILSITNNFEKVLGKGGFGTVYFGSLKGNPVAVKVLSPSAVHGYPQFQAEAQFLTRVHHKSLTSLIGYFDDETNRAIIYEFMSNGDLSKLLFGKDAHVLTWEERLEIALSAAYGLEYLHHGCKPPIIHRDIKSTNILLNEHFEASLTDYGLSRVFPDEGSTYESTVVAGTPGYFDPEYTVSTRLNEKSDVYSFGVVILEIITGRPAISREEDKAHVSQWVTFMLAKGDVKSIVDPKLEGAFDATSAWKATEVAMDCVCPSSVRRPTMSHVVTELEQSLEMARRSGRERERRSQSETASLSIRVERTSLVRRPTMSHVVTEIEQSLEMARRSGGERESRSQSETASLSIRVEPPPFPR